MSILSLFTLQFKEFLGTYNKVTENCFMDCVKDFTSRDVKAEEVNRTFRSLGLADRRGDDAENGFAMWTENV